MFVSHYEFIKYVSACYYKYASIVPVQTFYSVILIRVNKKVLPLHNYPCPSPPQKKNPAGYNLGLIAETKILYFFLQT